MLAEKLLPTIGVLHVDSLELYTDRIRLKLSVTQEMAACPGCQQPSGRVHSRYTRHFTDVPWAGRAVYVHLCVRRFFCDNPTCERVTFTEQVPGLIAPFAQRSQRLAAAQRVLGLALGGEAGARTAKKIGMGTSPDTILRLIRTTLEPHAATPRVLGIDDWAIRKGQTYGTILVDLERSQVIDVLPDRTSETVVAWLQQHPGIEVIARDRANGYAHAAAEGAPHAAQEADRFHLLMNLRETLERFFDRHQADLRKVKLIQVPKMGTLRAAPEIPEKAPSAVMPSAIQLRITRETRRQARFEEVRALKQQGVSRNEIARRLQMSVNTAARYLRADEYPLRQANPATVSKADTYASLLQQRWQTGCRSSRQLWTAIREYGFTGSESSVRRWLNHARATGQLRLPVGGSVGPPPSSSEKRGRVLSSRQAAWVLLRPPDELEDDEQDWLSQLNAICEPVGKIHELAQRFAKMVKQQVATDFVDWLQVAKSSGLVDLRNFAVGLQRDFDAVAHALTMSWSNGPTEGHVHRLKMIKRQMYGRAKFDLLRKRVLPAN